MKNINQKQKKIIKKLKNSFDKSEKSLIILKNNIDNFNKPFYDLFENISTKLKILTLNLAKKLGIHDEIIYEDKDEYGKVKLRTVVPRNKSLLAPGVVSVDDKVISVDDTNNLLEEVLNEIGKTNKLIDDVINIKSNPEYIKLKDENNELRANLKEKDDEILKLRTNSSSASNASKIARLNAFINNSTYSDDYEFYRDFYLVFENENPIGATNPVKSHIHTTPHHTKEKPKASIQIRNPQKGNPTRKPQSGGKRRRSRSKSKKLIKRRSRSKSRKLVKRRSRSRK